MPLVSPAAAHSNNAAPPAAPSIARQLLLFLALLLVVASETATGAFAEASWQVNLAFDSSHHCWILAGGPNDYSESSPDAAPARRIVEEQIKIAVDDQACYYQLFDDLEQALRENFAADRALSLSPPDLPPDADPHRVQMKFSFAAKKASAVRLILASEAVGLKPGNLQFGNELQLSPELDGVLLAPLSLAAANRASAGRLLDASLAKTAEALGDKLSFQVAYTRQEAGGSDLQTCLPMVDDNSASALGDESLSAQLCTIAAEVLAGFPAQGLVPGKVLDRDALNKALSEILTPIFGGVYRSQLVYEVEPNGRLDIVVILYAPLEEVDIEVRTDGNTQSSLQTRLQDRYLDDGTGNADRLITQVGRYPRAAEQCADMVYLAADPEVADVAPKETPLSESHYVFLVEPMPRATDELRLTASIGVTPETGVYGELGADLTKLPGMPDNVQSLSFSLKAGERVLGGEGDIRVSLIDNPGGGAGESLDGFIRGEAGVRSDVLYGNRVRNGVDARSQSLAAGLLWGDDSLTHRDRFAATRPFGPRRGVPRVLTKVEAGLGYLDVTLDGSPSDTSGLDQGSYVGPFVKADFLLTSYSPELEATTDPMRNEWRGRLDVMSGIQGLGGDWDFVRASLNTGPRIGLRFADDLPGYFRLGVSTGWASAGTPTFAYFGGGADFVRGIEQDEYIGRRYLGTQSEIGLDLFALWNRLAPPSDKGRQNAAATCASRIPTQDLYVAAFADFGWLAERVEDGIEQDSAKALRGFGIQLSVRSISEQFAPLDFSLGYAYSPDSERNPSGVVFSRINYQF